MEGVKITDVVLPGLYWARLPGVTQWFTVDIQNPASRYGENALQGFEFVKVSPPRPPLSCVKAAWLEQGGRPDDLDGFIAFAEKEAPHEAGRSSRKE